MRFSVLTLLALIGAAAMVLAALLNANEAWLRIAVTATVLSLLTSVAATVYLTGARRAFSFGFALFGLGYILLCWTAGGELQFLRMGNPFDLLYKTLPVPEEIASISDRQEREQAIFDTRRTFIRIGEAIWVVILSGTGGLIAKYFYWLRQKQGADSATKPE